MLQPAFTAFKQWEMIMQAVRGEQTSAVLPSLDPANYATDLTGKVQPQCNGGTIVMEVTNCFLVIPEASITVENSGLVSHT